MKVLAFAGSNSSKSINHELVSFAGSLLEDVQVIRLSNFEIPMYGIDLEEAEGIPDGIKKLAKIIDDADALLIAVAEHNGNVSAFFKNITDWLSRHERGFVNHKKVILLSTSPGGRGASSALEAANQTFTRFKADVLATWSLPSFDENFNEGSITNLELLNSLKNTLSKLN